MKYITEFREGTLAGGLVREIHRSARPIKIMEVCGGHTHVICKYGIPELLPEEVKLIHGPGCPVCVIPQDTIEIAIDLAQTPGVLMTCFGDMMRVPTEKGTLLSLSRCKDSVRMVYSPLDSLKLASSRPDLTIVFLAIGFETTAPSTALAIKRAKSNGIENFKVLSTHFLIPPAMKALVGDSRSKVDAFIAPGHVTTIIGLAAYEFLASELGCPVVVSGFEPLDIIQTIQMILKQAEEGSARVENQYTRAVRRDGNPVAQAALEEVFDVRESVWRGLGPIPGTGLGIAESYSLWDAEKTFDLSPSQGAPEPPGCRCGDVLKGIISPPDCSLFGKRCAPDSPVGPCMVSPEGACAAHYRYRTGEVV